MAKLKEKELKELNNIKCVETLKMVFPKATVIENNLSHVFFKLKKGMWMKCYYMLKDGTCCEQYDTLNTNDIDYNKFQPHLIYTGSDKKRNFTNIWKKPK